MAPPDPRQQFASAAWEAISNQTLVITPARLELLLNRLADTSDVGALIAEFSMEECWAAGNGEALHIRAHDRIDDVYAAMEARSADIADLLRQRCEVRPLAPPALLGNRDVIEDPALGIGVVTVDERTGSAWVQFPTEVRYYRPGIASRQTTMLLRRRGDGETHYQAASVVREHDETLTLFETTGTVGRLGRFTSRRVDGDGELFVLREQRFAEGFADEGSERDNVRVRLPPPGDSSGAPSADDTVLRYAVMDVVSAALLHSGLGHFAGVDFESEGWSVIGRTIDSVVAQAVLIEALGHHFGRRAFRVERMEAAR